MAKDADRRPRCSYCSLKKSDAGALHAPSCPMLLSESARKVFLAGQVHPHDDLSFVPAEMRAVSFYADPRTWEARPDADSRGLHTWADLDEGAKARDALSQYRPRHLVSAVALIVEPSGRFLAGRRKHPSGEGLYACPGGHLEFGETPVQAAVREAYEETGIKLDHLDGTLIDVAVDSNQVVGPWVVIFYRFGVSADIEVADKVASNGSWAWYPLLRPPEPMFPNLAEMLERHGPLLGAQLELR